MAAARRRRPGRWVTADGDAVARCRTAIHACQADHVPWWIQDELWEAELAEPVRLVGHKLTSPRGRLVRGVEASDAGVTRAFADACAFRARDRAVAARARGRRDRGGRAAIPRPPRGAAVDRSRARASARRPAGMVYIEHQRAAAGRAPARGRRAAGSGGAWGR